MADFHRVNVDDNNFIRGAARLLWAGTTVAFPTTIADIINVCTYDAMTGWNDLGATKTGITVTYNNDEETFDIDQIIGDIDSRPTTQDVSVATALAEMTLARLQIAWEGGTITSVTSGGQSESQMGVGTPATYTKRRLAVLFQKANGKIRAHVFRKVQRSPVEAAIAFNKTGEQQSVPIRFRALADTSITSVDTRYFLIMDQV
jgi:hypothetical protein